MNRLTILTTIILLLNLACNVPGNYYTVSNCDCTVLDLSSERMTARKDNWQLSYLVKVLVMKKDLADLDNRSRDKLKTRLEQDIRLVMLGWNQPGPGARDLIVVALNQELGKRIIQDILLTDVNFREQPLRLGVK